MGQLIVSDKDKCNLSYTCVRVCPAKAIKIADKHAQIIPERCIGCGNCVTMCQQGAISYRSSKEYALQLLEGPAKAAVICDSAIAAEFADVSDYRKLICMVRKLGFEYVTEMAFGVDLVALAYKELFEKHRGKYYITTKCPPIIKYVERQEPELVKNLAPIVPPYVAMSKVIHERYGGDVKTVYLTACTAAKEDAKLFSGTDGKVDAVITFTELRELFDQFNITEKSVEYSDFDPPLGRKGGLFPISHGLFQAVDINQNLLEANILITEGRDNFLQAIQEFKRDVNLNEHIDLFYCKGCFMGPGCSKRGKKYLRRSEIIKYVKKRVANLDFDNWQKEIDRYKDIDLSRSFKALDLRLPTPTNQEVEDVLIDMGKTNAEDILGCGACGYATCRDFAVSHLQGLSEYEQCYTYTNKKLSAFIDKLNYANDRLKKTQEALKGSEEQAKKDEQAAIEAADTTTSMLNKLRAGVVIVNKELKVIEANERFVEMMDEDVKQIASIIPRLKGADLASMVDFHNLFSSVLQSGQDALNRDVLFGKSILNMSIFTIKKNEIVGGIIRDLKTPEVRKEEVISRARAVIKENLETVQQIAFILGESAAKTEKTLNSIIEAQKLGGYDEPEQ